MSEAEVTGIIGKGYSCNVFLVRSANNFLVDAGLGLTDRILDLEDIVTVERIILTHRHVDHVGDAQKLSEKLEVPLYAPEKEAKALREGDDRTILGSQFDKKIPPLEVKDLEEEGYAGFEIIETPGHTEGSVCLFQPEEKILISGDTVFSNGSMGRTDLPTGDKDQLKSSLKKLSNLEVESLYPGHMSPVEKGANKHIERAIKNLKLM